MKSSFCDCNSTMAEDLTNVKSSKSSVYMASTCIMSPQIKSKYPIDLKMQNIEADYCATIKHKEHKVLTIPKDMPNIREHKRAPLPYTTEEDRNDSPVPVVEFLFKTESTESSNTSDSLEKSMSYSTVSNDSSYELPSPSSFYIPKKLRKKVKLSPDIQLENIKEAPIPSNQQVDCDRLKTPETNEEINKNDACQSLLNEQEVLQDLKLTSSNKTPEMKNHSSHNSNKKEYKKIINRKAAANYRQRKMAQDQKLQTELQVLEEHNAYLKEKINWLIGEIYKLKRISFASKLQAIQTASNDQIQTSGSTSPSCQEKIFLNQNDSIQSWQKLIVRSKVQTKTLPQYQQTNVVKEPNVTNSTKCTVFASSDDEIIVPDSHICETVINEPSKSPVVLNINCIKQEIPQQQTFILPDLISQRTQEDRCGSPSPVELTIDVKTESSDHSSLSGSCDTAYSLTNSTSTSEERCLPYRHQYVWTSEESSTMPCDQQMEKKETQGCEWSWGNSLGKSVIVPQKKSRMLKALKSKLKNKTQHADIEVDTLKDTSCPEVIRYGKRSKNPDYIKQKNRRAAIRYRQKKSEKRKSMQSELNKLEAHNTYLKEKIKSLQNEIYTLMRIGTNSRFQSTANKHLSLQSNPLPLSYDERIRIQNREATARYRRKMSERKKGLENETFVLEKKNKELKEKVVDLNDRISCLKRLFKDMIMKSNVKTES